MFCRGHFFVILFIASEVAGLGLSPSSLKRAFASVAVSAVSFLPLQPSLATDNPQNSIASIVVQNKGETVPMKELLGKKATLIVNVASYCALTPQYEGLVALDTKYHDKGLQILGFPSNDFGQQEPDPIDRIRADTAANYGVKFPLLDKISVNGPSESPLYKKLKSIPDIGLSTSTTKAISWNFEKFLVDEDGVPVRRYKPGVLPENLDSDVQALLNDQKLKPRPKPSLNN